MHFKEETLTLNYSQDKKKAIILILGMDTAVSEHESLHLLKTLLLPFNAHDLSMQLYNK